MKKRGNGDQFYEIFGTRLRRVTSILGRLQRFGLEEWQASSAIDFMMKDLVLPLMKGWMTLEQLRETDLERIRKAAMSESKNRVTGAQDRGRDVHRIIDDYYRRGQDRTSLDRAVKIEPDLAPAIEAFKKWEDGLKVRLVASEKTVFSFSRKFAGKLDLDAEVILPNEDCGEDPPRRRFVFDFKTGAHDPKNVLQIAAYTYALEEMERIEVYGAGLVYLDPVLGIPKQRLYERRQLIMPFMLFQKLKEFVELEEEWRSHETIEEGPGGEDTSNPLPSEPQPEEPPPGPPDF